MFDTAKLPLYSHNICEKVYAPMLGNATNLIRKRGELVSDLLGHPKPAAWKEILAEGREQRLPILPGGLNVYYLGARNKDGMLPGLSRVSMPVSQ